MPIQVTRNGSEGKTPLFSIARLRFLLPNSTQVNLETAT